MRSPSPRERDLLLVYPQWQGAGALDGLRSSALALGAAVAGRRRRVDIEVPAGHPLAVEAGIHGRDELLRQLGQARKLLDSEPASRVFAVGGDCGIEPAVIGYLNARYEGALAVIWLDAHPDLNTPTSSPSGHFHGMPLRVLLGEGDPGFTALVDRPLRPHQVVLVGMRAPDSPERAFIQESRIRTLSSDAMNDGTCELLRWLRVSGFERVYVHLDLDVCDPGEVARVACPTPGGIAVRMLQRALGEISDELEIVGASLTEAFFEGSAIPAALESLLGWFRTA